MNVALIDGMGVVRRMVVTSLSVRVPITESYVVASQSPEDYLHPNYKVVEFCDSGLVLEDGTAVLTPGGKDVPLGRCGRVYRRACWLWADVFVSDYEMRDRREDVAIDRLVWELAHGHMLSMVSGGARVVLVSVREIIEKREPFARCYRVYGEEQECVTLGTPNEPGLVERER